VAVQANTERVLDGNLHTISSHAKIILYLKGNGDIV